MNNAFHYLVERHVLSGAGQKLALMEPGRPALNYRQLEDGSRRMGQWLLSFGIKREEPVGLLFPDSQELVLAFLACLRLGAVAVPLNPFLPGQSVTQLRRDWPGAFIATSRGFAESLDSQAAPIVVSDRVGKLENLDQIEGGTDGPRPVDDASQPAYWLYTSGSTGVPKAVIHTHAGIVASLNAYPRQILRLSADDRCYSTSKCFFAYGLGNSVLFPLGAGAATLLDPAPSRPDRIVNLLAEFSPTVFFSIPTLYRRILDEPSFKPECCGSIRICVSAGEPLPPAVSHHWARRTGRELVDGIGSTEALHIFCSNRPGRVRAGTTGTPVPGYDLRLVDDLGHPVAEGSVGQLQVRGPTIARGYWNAPTAQARNFAGEWLRTGDLYRRDSEGNYVYSGRVDDGIKSSGMWIIPVEIEQLILGQEGVAEAAVVPGVDPLGLQILHAYVVPRDLEMSADAQQQFISGMLSQLSRNLPAYKVPRKVELLTELPRTATGKVARQELKARAAVPPGGRP